MMPILTFETNLKQIKYKKQLHEEFFLYLASVIGSVRYLIREVKINTYCDATVYVNGNKVSLVLLWLRDDSLEYMRHLIDMTCVDHIDRENRFNIWYTGLSCTNQKRYNIFTMVAERELAISSMTIFKSLNWSEREA